MMLEASMHGTLENYVCAGIMNVVQCLHLQVNHFVSVHALATQALFQHFR
jgi:hypothetical protein